MKTRRWWIGVLAASLAIAPARGAPRVVSLAPGLTELVYALGFGECLVGRSSACDAPPEVLALPVAGGFGRPDQEALLEIRPDLLLYTDLEKSGMVNSLRRAGIEPLRLPCESWSELMDAARAISRALERPEVGRTWTDGQEARRRALADRAAAFWGDRPRPSVYVELWGNPPMTAGRRSFLHDLVELAGGRNIGAALDRGYAAASLEWVIAEDPDAIVLAYMTADAPVVARLARRPGWDTLRAVRNGSVCHDIPPDWLLRPGPRVLLGAEALFHWLAEQDFPGPPP